MSIGKRIRLSRRAAGLSLRDLEARIGNRVSAQAISKYERDESVPGSGVLIALANALGESVDYLASDTELALESVEFRNGRLPDKRTEARVEARILDLLERYLAVEEILGLPAVTRDLPRVAPWPVLNDVMETEQAALGLRHHWGLGLGPIPNLVEILEGRGIKVLSMPLANVGGLAASVHRKDRNVASVIVVNRKNGGEHQRFAAAQELGHMVLDVGPRMDAEKAAHRFAGAFLMPADTLRGAMGRHRQSTGWGELFGLKRMFGVSVQALTCRCGELGIFGNSLSRRLLGEFKHRGWSSPPYEEPWAMNGEEPKRFERLCCRALAEGVISESRAAELFGHSVHDLMRLMDEPPDMESATATN